MDPMLAELGEVAAGLEHRAPRVPWAGALTGELVTDPDGSYWVRQAREAVRYADAVTALAAQGVSVFVEIGPDGTLSALGAAVADGGGVRPGAAAGPARRAGAAGRAGPRARARGGRGLGRGAAGRPAGRSCRRTRSSTSGTGLDRAAGAATGQAAGEAGSGRRYEGGDLGAAAAGGSAGR